MAGLKVRCIDNRPYLKETERGLTVELHHGEMASLTIGQVYEVLSEEHGFYRIVDNTGEDYLYPKEMFAILTC